LIFRSLVFSAFASAFIGGPFARMLWSNGVKAIDLIVKKHPPAALPQ
jgi:hypothetical protein